MLLDVEGYKNLYAVTEDGKVWSYKRKKFLKPCCDKLGYLFVNLCKDGKYRSFKIHRLVANAFVDNPYNKPEVNHKDENKKNNCIENLEWVTRRENNNYGTHNSRSANSRKKPVICVELNKEFDCAKNASAILNLSAGNICTCLKNENKTCGGFHWKYA